MGHPNFSRRRINLFLPDDCEMAAKKSAIFSLPFHNHRVKRDLSFFSKKIRATHIFSQFWVRRKIGLTKLLFCATLMCKHTAARKSIATW
jgi:hypothetical protein